MKMMPKWLQLNVNKIHLLSKNYNFFPAFFSKQVGGNKEIEARFYENAKQYILNEKMDHLQLQFKAK